MRPPLTAFLVPALLLSACATPHRAAKDNPFSYSGAPLADGRPGQFAQGQAGDCFFLASLIALGQDEDGRQLLNAALRSAGNGWRIVFPNFPEEEMVIAEKEIARYRLLASDGLMLAAPVHGDPDVAMLEIAADRLWKRRLKAEGLWDDVPMNAVYLFTGERQRLLWNRARAADESVADVDQYRTLAGDSVQEIAVKSAGEAETALQSLIADDNDGISLILIDYAAYHATAIVAIDFVSRKYVTLDTYANETEEKPLDGLLQGLADGLLALDYIEPAPAAAVNNP